MRFPWACATLVAAFSTRQLRANYRLDVTPVEKVGELLKKLKTQITKEGEQEAVQFAKLEEFARNQNNDKIHRTNKAAAAWKRLDARIEALATEIEAKNGEIEATQGDIAATTKSKNTNTKECSDAWKKHEEANAALLDDIGAVTRAVEYVKGNVAQLEDAHPASFLSVLQAAQRQHISARHLHTLTSMLGRHQRQQPAHAYKHKSSPVVDLLQNLLQQFKERQREKDVDARAAKHSCSLEIQNYGNQISASENLNAERADVIARNTEEKSVAEKEQADSAQELKDDVAFAFTLNGCNFVDEFTNVDKLPITFFEKDYKGECGGGAERNVGEFGERKATYEERKETRRQELEALTKAIALMDGEGGEKYAANKRLVGLITKHVQPAPQKGDEDDDDEDDKDDEDVDEHADKHVDEHTDKHADKHADEHADEHADGHADEGDEEDEEEESDHEGAKDVSFVQVSRKTGEKRLVKFLLAKAHTLRSPTLAALVLQMRADHFEKVRALINDLITKLENQLVGEQEQKVWCDTELTTTNEKRRELETELETTAAHLDSDNALGNVLKKDIQDQQQKIAALSHALDQRTEIEASAKKVNEQTVEDAKAGLVAVQDAIKILESFYAPSPALLVQQPTAVKEHKEWKAEGADSSGKTVGDAMPANVFDEKYEGKTAESTGIIGLLKVIESDYERTAEGVAEEITKSQKAFDEFKKETSLSIEDGQETKKTKEGEQEDAQTRILENEDALEDRKSQLKNTMEYLDSLKPMCASADAGVQLEERRKRREQEIGALREALELLRSASFLSRE
eukprot:GEMP01009442.1.p1 GENE.GEMP01009442.1~~GEMP01009442.1.p1  ORF type:complete len:802 (+),score=315.75 GEMP01009442.1:117-2522(+)